MNETGGLAAAVTVTVPGQVQEECAQSRHSSRDGQPRNVPEASKHTDSAAVDNNVGIYKPPSPVINCDLPVCTAAPSSLLLTGYYLDRLHVLTQGCLNICHWGPSKVFQFWNQTRQKLGLYGFLNILINLLSQMGKMWFWEICSNI